ncbi:hypothetical protein [Carboxylicivirga sp. RSCT41]|uniref:hypothetical protein n=1 Tax=Carboxylicivirga agarovorans TaxID=3417570 RepID=UPI003D34EE25
MKIHIKKHIQSLLQKVDRQDKALSHQKRKIKWISILGTLFILYILSFMQPNSSIEHRLIKTPREIPGVDSLSNDSSQLSNSLFTLPVDSFEQLLNKKIHETSK